MQESSLHAALKDFYTRSEQDAQEVSVDGYLIDVVSGELLIEVQTGNFSALKEKLPVLLANHPLLLVHPIAQEKWIVRLAERGETPLKRRKSPRRGRVEHVFLELVRIPHLIRHPNFSLEVVMTPVTYQVTGFLKRSEQEDVYDTDTDFNPFKVAI